jgi:hypothetical protein
MGCCDFNLPPLEFSHIPQSTVVVSANPVKDYRGAVPTTAATFIILSHSLLGSIKTHFYAFLRHPTPLLRVSIMGILDVLSSP